VLIKQFCVDLQIITLVRLPIGGDALTWWEVYSTRLETNISRSIYSNTRKNSTTTLSNKLDLIGSHDGIRERGKYLCQE
jgi:hypothetical protein